MATMATEDYVPCFCRACNEISDTNTITTPFRCTQCGSERIELYSDKLDADGRTERRLEDIFFPCPRCNQRSLKFVIQMFWD